MIKYRQFEIGVDTWRAEKIHIYLCVFSVFFMEVEMIKINEDFTIKSYSQGYKVYRELHKSDKKGNPLYDFLGYATDIPHALGMIQKRMEREKVDEGDWTLKEAIEQFKAIHDDLYKDFLSIEQTIKNHENTHS